MTREKLLIMQKNIKIDWHFFVQLGYCVEFQRSPEMRYYHVWIDGAVANYFVIQIILQTKEILLTNVCLSAAKPGTCPAAPTNLTGVACKPIDECTYDADCDRDFKCCSNGCRLTCQRPGISHSHMQLDLRF